MSDEKDLHVIEKDLEKMIPELTSIVSGSRLAHMKLQSSGETKGYDKATNQVLSDFLSMVNIGVGRAAEMIGVKKKKLKAMLDGHVDMDNQVLLDLCRIIKEKDPTFNI